MELYNTDDIVALATPPGSGALSIVRFSGNNLQDVYKKFSHKKPKNRRAVFTKIYHPINNNVLDHSIITYFKSPNSFTGEDVIEITCHGGKIVSRSIIDAAIDNKIRVAGPGEFSFRAFLNGKIDLVQAESIASLIESNSKLAANHSLNHLDGRVSKIFSRLKDDAVNILTIIENELNFSEEEINFISIANIKKYLSNIQDKLNDILLGSTFGCGPTGERRIAILGRSNSGKSSLFNTIIGYDRAIVSSVPGTTRDTIEFPFEIDGIPVCLIDTAGFWESDDYIDQISIKKASLEFDRSDICIILDETNPKKLIQSKFFKKIRGSSLLIRSKCDDKSLYIKNNNNPDILPISSKHGYGISRLLTDLSTMLHNNVSYDPDLISSITRRQRALLEDALLSIVSAIEGVDGGVDMDILASILHDFVFIMRDIIGNVSNKDVLNNIFSNFCIGK